ncbi:MAG TPA: tripartite tricarboxylate transporter permease [Selenomonadales bacterium]|nr:tripartite tricarboxylate transporter permease [Selenomonadales bacterium]
METFGYLIQGFSEIFTPQALFYCLLGVTLGNFIGALPGLGPSAGTAILLPIAASMPPAIALIMLCGIYYGAMYGGTITSVLLNIPGESSAIMSAVEGFKLAKKGRGGVALGIAAIGSFIAGTIGVIALTFFAPPLAEKALLFGPAEKFALLALAFTFVSSFTSGALSKSLIALFLGLLAATVGQDVLTGVPRLTFDTEFLLDGIDFVPVVMGFFALAEVMNEMEKGEATEEIGVGALGRVIPNAQELRESAMPCARGTFLGFICGLLPGAGATIASFLAYGAEKRYSKRSEEFGHGSLDAIASTESANNAASAGHMIPLMALAIPGSSTTAILLTGFMMFGLQPGPLLFTQHPDIAWSLIASMYMGNVMLLIMNIVGIPLFVWAVKKSTPFLVPLVVTITIAGVFSVNNSMRDVWLTIACCLVGYILTKLEFSMVPILLGVVLGGLAETSFRTALRISDGSFMTFLDKPISATLLFISLIIIVAPIVMSNIKKRRALINP